MALPVLEVSSLKIAVFVICSLIILLGCVKKLTDGKASLAAMILGFYFIFFFPLYWFSSLLLLYLATSLATKQKNGDNSSGHKKGRKITNILCNLGSALIFSGLFLLDGQPAFYLAFLCSAACACSDTLASEIGKLSGTRPRLITNWKEVPTGVDVAVSTLGLFAAVFGSILTAFPAIFMQPGSLALGFFLTASTIGFIGCNIDSFIGAMHQTKGRISNDVTNLISTLICAFLGLMIGFLVF